MKKFLTLLLTLVMLSGFILAYVFISENIAKKQDSYVFKVVEDGVAKRGYSNLQEAVDNCNEGGTIMITNNCAVLDGATIDKNITISGQFFTIDISNCLTAFINVLDGATVNVRNLILDGKSEFEVNYEAVTYTDVVIPIKKDSQANDILAEQSAVISSGSIYFENVDIINRYTSSSGGAVKILAGNARFNDCNFNHNNSTSRGGAIYIGSALSQRTTYPVKSVNFNNCNFKDNYSLGGGAIYAFNAEQINITKTQFISNVANRGNGGAISLTNENTLAISLNLDYIQTTITDCIFEENWAGNDGFAINSFDSDLYVYNTFFTKNVGVHPTSSVGTISVQTVRNENQDWRIYTLLDTCVFSENFGACSVYGDHSSVADFDAINCIFKDNVGLMSFLLRSSVSHLKNCQFINEKADIAVIDTSIHEDFLVAPLLTIENVTFTNCTTSTEILNRKQEHNLSLQTYEIKLLGTTNGDINILDSNKVFILGNHSGNVFLDKTTDRLNLVIDNKATLNGIIIKQPNDVQCNVGDTVSISVNAEGDGLNYLWFYKDTNMSDFMPLMQAPICQFVMTNEMAGRQLVCIVSDQKGNSGATGLISITCLNN